MRPIRSVRDILPDTTFADLLESADAYLVVLDVPGASADTTEITARNRFLDIVAGTETTVPEEFEYRSGSRSTDIEATIPLPPDADIETATANIEQGVLEVEVPKKHKTVESTSDERET